MKDSNKSDILDILWKEFIEPVLSRFSLHAPSRDLSKHQTTSVKR